MKKTHNPLFNQKLIIREIKDISIPKIEKKINVIKRWSSNELLDKFSEEQLKPLFFKDIFIDILGYKDVISGGDKWTFEIEQKTELDGTKPDGILGFYTSSGTKKLTQVVIEMKSFNLNLDEKQKRGNKDYGTPIQQAFSYVHKYDNCKWVIASNFQEVRLYKVGRSQEYYEKFLLKDLQNDINFKRFYVLLCKSNLISEYDQSYTYKLSDQADALEINITKEFYNKYKDLRLKLINALDKLNPNIDIMEIIRSSQKLLDRIIFIRFCEDKSLLPVGGIQNRLKIGRKDPLHSIWGELKLLFKAIDEGNINANINKFNGELFKDDQILDNLTIPDNLFEELHSIIEYDFLSDLNVNILGRIFEQSITDLEEIRKELKVQNAEKGSLSRKKEGIFYTPEFMTKYIIEHTLGNYLSDLYLICKYEVDKNKIDMRLKHYKDMGLTKEEIYKLQRYKLYRDKLSNLKVLDPACGSGAFLVQVFDYLHHEYRRVKAIIDELSPELEGQFSMLDLNKHILSSNLYGVDLNEESVEITKLSLWLKTAEKNKQLTSLDDSIKCGNSLMCNGGNYSDIFDWEREFPEVFKNGGFDVIVGNPPYIEWHSINPREYLENGRYLGVDYKYRINHKDSHPNIYMFFYILCSKLLKADGRFGLITSQEWLNNDKVTIIKDYLIRSGQIKNIIFDSQYNVFVDPDGTVIGTNSSITFFKKNSVEQSTSLNVPLGEEEKFLNCNECSNNEYIVFNKEKWNYKGLDINLLSLIKDKIYSIDSIPLSDNNYFDVFGGFQPPVNQIPFYSLTKDDIHKIPERERQILFQAILDAKEIDRYKICKGKSYWIVANTIIERELKKEFPYIYRILEKRIMNKDIKSYEFPNIRNINKFAEYDEKLLVPRSKKYNAFAYDNKRHVFKGTNTAVCVKKDFDIKYILGIVNSSLFTYWYTVEGKDYHGNSRKYEPNNVKKIRIPKLNDKVQKDIEENVSIILLKQQLMDKLIQEFTDWISFKTKFKIDDFSLLNHEFQFFIDALNIRKISPNELNEIRLYFDKYSNEYNNLYAEQKLADKKIDEIVYQMYNINTIEINKIEDYVQ